MKLSAFLASAALAVSFATAAMAEDCTRTTAPSPIDGKTATQEQMSETHQAVKAYMTATDAFLTCIAKDADAQKAAVNADGSLDSRAKKSQVNAIESSVATRHNAAVGEMETVAASFNQAIKDFKAQQGK